MPGGASQPRKQLDAWQEWAKQRGAQGPGLRAVGEDGELGGPVAKNLSDAERAGLAAHVGAAARRLRVLRRGRGQAVARRCSARPALEIGRRCGLIDESAWSFLWVVDAPLFEPSADADAAATSPSAAAPGPPCTTRSPRRSRSGIDRSTTDPGRGAGLRLRHRLQRQRDRWRLDPYPPPRRAGAGVRRDGPRRERRRRRSSASCSRRSRSAPPPHGGIAFGWDRIVRAARGRRVDPRGHRVPEDRRRLRPAHRCAGADHARAAQGAGVDAPPPPSVTSGGVVEPDEMPVHADA